MKLPHHQNVIISREKLTDYLLSELHPVGRFKAKLFASFGFNQTNVEFLEKELWSIAQTAEVVEKIASPHGTKYILQGQIKTPVGREVPLKTIWITEPEQTQPRFVTAYPV